MKHIGLILLVTGLSSFSMGSGGTLWNLREAYKDEAMASRKYEQYAIKAEKEGYHEVAELFAALSESERVHMDNHKAAIRAMGVVPGEVPIEDMEVGSTRENLKKALKSEKKEGRSEYSKRVKKAEKEENCMALESFSYAEDSERQHYELLNQALEDMDQLEEGDYYVSDLTGKTYKVRPGGEKPLGESEKEELLKIYL